MMLLTPLYNINMRQFAKLLLPEKAEVVLTLSISAFLLIVINAKRFWLVVDGSTAVSAATINSFDSYLSNLIQRLDTYVNPNWLDFIMWLIIGGLGFLVFSFITATVKSAEDEAEIMHYYSRPQGRHHEAIVFLSRIVARMVGVLGLLFWIYTFFGVILPFCSKLFFTSVSSLPAPTSIFWLILSITIFAVGLYGFMVFARVITLRPRVFS
jgi:hypothetical protein